MGRYFALANQLSGCINLSLGEPDFTVSRSALNTGFRAVVEGKTHYAPTNGVVELREALVRKANRDYGLKYDPDSEVPVTVGASEAISLAFLALLNHGDEVIIPDPGFVAYEPCVALSGGKAVGFPCERKMISDLLFVM